MARFDGYVNFSAGELSPQLRGRVDLDAYRHGLARCVNMQPLHFGGIRRRNGTEYIMAAKDTTARGRLLPFVISPEQAYIVELGGNTATLRVHLQNTFLPPLYSGSTPPDFAMPYTQAQLRDVQYAQRGNFMVLTHPSHLPYALSRVSDTVWNMRPVPFKVLPTADLGVLLAGSAGLSVTSGTGSQTATATGATFLVADVGRVVTRGTGFGYITAVASGTSATINVLQTFGSTLGDWFIGGSPKATLSGIAIAVREGEQTTLTAAATAFRVLDAGSLIYANDGIYRVETSSTTVATVTVLRAPTSGSNSDAWFMRQPLFGGQASNPTWGNPATVTFHDQRMILGGFPNKPQAFVGSVAGDVLDFTTSSQADDSYAWEVFSDQSDTIRHLIADNDLLVLTGSTEYAASGQDYGTITNADVRVRPQSTYGSSNVQPVKVGRDHVYVQRDGRTVLSTRYDIQIQGYDSHDLTVLAEHITAAGIVELAYQRRPIPTLYAVLANGQMACCTLDPAQKVTAWWQWRHAAGLIESVCCVPNGQRDDVWMLVRHDGFTPTRWYIERVQTTYSPSSINISNPVDNPRQAIGYFVDTARQFPFNSPVYGSGFAITYAHLAGRPVQIVSDGADGGSLQLDSGGSGNTALQAYETVVGMIYNIDVMPMPVEQPTASGTGLGRSSHSSTIAFVLHQTVGGTYNGQVRPGGTVTAADGTSGQPVTHNYRATEKTGHHIVAADGWKIDAPQWRIQSSKPLPLHVLAVVPKTQTNP
jgi:hypothetical protein